MTGVSLAGTQLRVNQYNMHDTEWNDVKVSEDCEGLSGKSSLSIPFVFFFRMFKVTTINGAMVLPDKKDILIPQGVAHSVDRVMFPLPVGDILQTLQSDRERRFTNFLRALFSSGLSELLQNKGQLRLSHFDQPSLQSFSLFRFRADPASSKTYTVFAPIDTAFGNRTQEEINFIVTDKETAHKLVMRHITAGTLFTTGMRFYQVRDSLLAGNAITLQKTGGGNCPRPKHQIHTLRSQNNKLSFFLLTGKIKVNESQITTTNVPATNGVIHAIDTLL